MKMNILTRAAVGALVFGALAGSANADVVYKYTAPAADAITSITPAGGFTTSPYAGSGPLFSFSFTRAGNEIKSLTGAELDGMSVLFTYGGVQTKYTYVYNVNDFEQPFLEFAEGNLERPVAWDLHSFVNVAGIGPLFFESTTSFDFVRRQLADGSYLALSAGVPESMNSQGVWSVTQVPEPSSLSMLALAGGLMFVRRKTFKRKA
jgi:hypothetical protein